MSFHDVQFPADISYGAQGGPGFSTAITEAASGFEQRNINWSRARGNWQVQHSVKTDAQYAVVLAFFYARYGRAYGFRFKDPGDYKVRAGVLGGVADGANLVFQCQKIYTDSAGSYVRRLTRPCTGLVTDATGYTPPVPVIYVNGAVSAFATVNFATGAVTFAGGHAPPAAAVVTGDFDFDVPCRFDEDQMKASFDDFDAHTWPITVMEIREI